jgi:ParB-like chromosome segregation protein Spo0J
VVLEARDIDAELIQGINYPKPERVARLKASMDAHGWEGRPLLVEELGEAVYVYASWTGSHRLQAARLLRVAVPCRIMSKTLADIAFAAAGYDKYGFQSWREAVTKCEGPSDKHRLQGLLKAGLAEAAQMLQEEIASEEW